MNAPVNYFGGDDERDSNHAENATMGSSKNSYGCGYGAFFMSIPHDCDGCGDGHKLEDSNPHEGYLEPLTATLYLLHHSQTKTKGQNNEQ
jgi:hypothetical protein